MFGWGTRTSGVGCGAALPEYPKRFSMPLKRFFGPRALLAGPDCALLAPTYAFRRGPGLLSALRLLSRGSLISNNITGTDTEARRAARRLPLPGQTCPSHVWAGQARPGREKAI